MSVQEYARLSATTAHPGTLAGHHEFSSHHCTDAKGQIPLL